MDETTAIEIAGLVLVIITSFWTACVMYLVGNHQGGLTNALLALFFILLPTATVVLMSVQTLTFLSRFPSIIVMTVQFVSTAICSAVACWTLSRYYSRHPKMLITNVVISFIIMLTSLVLLALVPPPSPSPNKNNTC